MWICKKCGRPSGRRISYSYDCEHDWRDAKELAKEKEEAEAKRARQQEETEAEMQREIFEFNDGLWNREEGLKLLKGEMGWSWLRYNKYEQQPKRVEIYWRDSAFGTEWFLSEYGQQYLDYAKNEIIQMSSAEPELFELLFETDNGGYLFGIDWLRTEQGKQYVNALQTLLKEKEAAESKKLAWTSSEKRAKKDAELQKILFEVNNGLCSNADKVLEELQRIIFEVNDDLWNTEKGLKLLKGEIGWDWLLYNKQQPKRVEIYWRDSVFGTEWFRSEYGQQYLNYVKSLIQTSSNVGDLDTYIGNNWLESEQGVQYMNALLTLLKEKEAAESKKFEQITDKGVNHKAENQEIAWLSEKKDKKRIGPLGFVILILIIAIIVNAIAILIF